MDLSRFIAFLFLAAFFTETQASASTVHRYEVPALLGQHSHIEELFPIDLKSTLSSIARVELYLEGTVSPGSAVGDNGQKELQLPVRFDIAFTDQSQTAESPTWVSYFGPLSGSFGIQSLFYPRYKANSKNLADWSFLKNGTGNLLFSWGNECSRGCRYINHPTVEITKAILSVIEEVKSPSSSTKEKSLGKLILSPGSVFTAGSPIAPVPEIRKKQIELKKAFLLRSSDELNKAVGFVNELVAVLKQQGAAVSEHESRCNLDERSKLLDWYQRYASWIKGKAAVIEAITSRSVSRTWREADLAREYEDIAIGFRKLADDARGSVSKLEGDKSRVSARMKRLLAAIRDRRLLLDKDGLEIARELWPDLPVAYNQRKPIYKNLTGKELDRLSDELVRLKEQEGYFHYITEFVRYEQQWLNMMSQAVTKQQELAKALDGNSLETMETAVNEALRNCESNIRLLKSDSAQLAGLHSMDRPGTMKALDLIEELSLYYETMKSRFDCHLDLLGSHVGSYRADLVEINR